MITIVKVDKFNNTVEMYGLSTDIKPTEDFEFCNSIYRIRNGSRFYEMDTEIVSLFDEENKQWIEQ